MAGGEVTRVPEVAGPQAAVDAAVAAAPRRLPGGLDPERATVLDLQRAMDRGRLSSVQLVAFYTARIRALNPLLHAVITVNQDAVREAVASDVRRRHHDGRGALE